jgi:hypothetical protein
MTADAPHVLFLHSGGEDYLADSLMHGLRLVLGDRAVDVPRRDALYADFPDAWRDRLYGRGFTLYRRLPALDVYRGWPLRRALEGEFDVVVLGELYRDWGAWVQLRPHLKALRRKGVTVAALDGADGTTLFPFGLQWARRMRPWPLPRAHGRIPYFKRELTPAVARLARGVRPLAFSIPEEHLASGDEPKTRLLATHVVDSEVAALVPGSATGYAFDTEADYYADLRSARFGITTRKAGWDCMRHYELAASGCVPCFRDLHRKPVTSAPHGLDATNCVPYTDPAALLRELEAMDDERYERLRAGALAWARENTTRRRAQRFLAELGHPVAA